MTHHDEILTLCRNLRLLRQQNQLTEQEMAAILYINLHTLRLLERDTIPPKLSCDFLFYASSHFHIKLCDFFLPLEERPPE